MEQEAETNPPWHSLIDSNNLKNDLQRIYDSAFIEELAAIVGTGATNPNLFLGIESAVRAYLFTRREMTRRKPGKLETRRIEPVADAAQQLFLALSKLNDTPNPQLKIIAALEEEISNQTGRGADLLSLAQTRHGPGDPLRTLREISALLATSTAQIVGKAPGDPTDDRTNRSATILKTELDVWANRKRKTETDPVLALVRAFRPTWLGCSASPYTEGMYRKAERRSVSSAVDSILLIGRKIDPKLSRARVGTAFRHLPPS